MITQAYDTTQPADHWCPVYIVQPFNILGAVVCAAVVSLFDYEQAIYLFRVRS
jgi:hypothetical protein